MRFVKSGGGTFERDALEVTKPWEDELDEYAEKVPHLRTFEVYLYADGDARTDPTLEIFATFYELNALSGVLTTCLVCSC